MSSTVDSHEPNPVPSDRSIRQFQRRLKTCLQPLLDRLECFLDKAEAGASRLWLILPEEDVQAARECLLRLGLTRDADQLEAKWHPLNEWHVQRMHEHLGALAASPKAPPDLVAIAHRFPSAEDLAASTEDRQHRDQRIVLDAGQLAALLRKLLATVSEQPEDEAPAGRQAGASDGPAIDKESEALGYLFKHPEWSIAQIAKQVGVGRQALYGWPKFRQAAELTGKLKPRAPKDGAVPRGHKTSDGRIEAYADPAEDE
jgi:hypothetical protein